MAHDTPLVGCDSNSPSAASALHPTIQYVLCQVHGESAEARPVLECRDGIETNPEVTIVDSEPHQLASCKYLHEDSRERSKSAYRLPP